MHWLNLQTSVLHAPEFVGCRPVARATWLAVMLWCVQQENGGRIAGARAWNSRRWQQTCGVTMREINLARPLLSWEGDDLVVWSYPLEKEIELRESRAYGAIGGRARAANKNAASSARDFLAPATSIAPAEASPRPATPVESYSTRQASLAAGLQGSLQRKGKEGNGMEKKATGHAHDGSDCDGGEGLIATGAPRSANAMEASEARDDSPTAQAVERIVHRASLEAAAAPGLALGLALGCAVDSAPSPRSPAQAEHSATRDIAEPGELSAATGLLAATGLEPAMGSAIAAGSGARAGVPAGERAAADAKLGGGVVARPEAQWAGAQGQRSASSAAEEAGASTRPGAARGDAGHAMGGENSRAPEGTSDGDGQGAGAGGLVPTLAEVVAYGSSPHANAPEEVCAVWWNDHEARPRHALGGYTDRTGQPVRNWRASLRAFALRWRNQEEQQRRRQPPSRGPRAAPVPRALQGPQRPPAVGFRVGF